jgi:putative membrane protein
MNPFLSTFLYFIIAVVIVIIGLLIFELITHKYRDWEEIDKGNTAVALSIAGKIIGICLVLSFSIYNSSELWETLIWGAYGVVLQMIAYFVFEGVTRRFSVQAKLKENNVAVGVVSLAVSVGLGFVIGASIT